MISLQAAACSVAVVAIVTSFHATSAATLLPKTISINATSYSEQITLSAVSLQAYCIISPVASGIYYNVRIQLDSLEGHAGFYCNPSWGGQPDTTNLIAQPKNSVWQTDNSGSDRLTISANDPLYLPPNSITSAILSGLPSSSPTYQPAFNCSAINPSTANTALFNLTVTFDANNHTLPATEVEGITTIYQSCCMGSTSCLSWKNRTQGFGNPPYTNFCQFQGQSCTSSGHLEALDLTSFGLSCALPSASLALFSSLETLVLSDNPELVGSLPTLMSQVANLANLRHVEMKQDTGIKGPLADTDPDTSAGLCSMVQNGLRYLDFSNMQLTGSLPDCLLASPGILAQLGFSNNNLTGVVPDVIPTNTSLFTLVLASNSLTGSIPKTIVNARMLSDLELDYNLLDSNIPEDFGAGMSLLSTVQLSNNSLTGTLPTPLATSISLSGLDVSYNHLSAFPPEWSDGFANASASMLQRIFVQQNQIQGPFPETLTNFSQLLFLDASHNQISGTLPDVTGMFEQTRVFDVAYNNLSSTIPAAFQSLGAINKSMASLLVAPGVSLRNKVDLSHNMLTGAVPGFLASSAVPATLTVALVGNNLTADCGNTSYTYLDICNELVNSSVNAPAVLPTVPASLPVAAPSGSASPSGLVPAPATPSDVNGVATNSGTGKSSSSDLGLGGIAGIVVGVVIAAAVGATAVVVYLKRRRTTTRSLLRMQSSGGFSRFEDF